MPPAAENARVLVLPLAAWMLLGPLAASRAEVSSPSGGPLAPAGDDEPVAASAAASDDAPSGPRREAPRRLHDAVARGVGRLVPDLALTALDGTTQRLSALQADAVVIVMRDLDCPVSQRQGPTLARLEETFAGRPVAFVHVHPLLVGGPEPLAEDAAARGLGALVVPDPEGVVAARLGAVTTTEAFVLDGARTLRYRGAVDDQYGIGYAKPAPTARYLEDAVERVLSGDRVSVAATTAPGCLLDLEPEVTAEGTATWHGDVSRILLDRCVSCHRTGGPAPFPLDREEVARSKSRMIRFAIEAGIMPPWGAAPGTGPWANDLGLAPSERRTLFAWMDAGHPSGDPDDAPLPRTWPDTWSIGEPDAVYTVDESFTVPAEGVVDYRYTYVKTDQPEDRWVSAVEILPTAKEVVHHVLVFVESPEASHFRGGLHGYFAGYIPGQGARVFPDGVAKKLPAGAWLKFQIHYTANGSEAVDRPSIGFVFADEAPRHEVTTSALSSRDFSIPPGAGAHEVVARGGFRNAVTLLGFSPHMHLRGKAFRYDLVTPDGETQRLLDVPAYDFNWQTMYQLAEPLEVPAGSELVCTAWFDNSLANPANPDPDAWVGFGEQTWDEMMIGYFEWWRP